MHHRSKRALALIVLPLLVVGACSDDEGDDAGDGSTTTQGQVAGEPTSDELSLQVVSTQPEHVTGGDALVELTGPGSVELTLDGEPFGEWEPNGEAMRGLVDGMSDGDHELVATAGDQTASVTITNHPIAGPVFSGPHLPLEACSTETYDLGAPDDDCMVAEPVIRWSYVNTEGERLPLDDPTAVPDDADTLADGETPFVLREERGTINRAVYWITVVDSAPDPDNPGTWEGAGWNGRLVYEYGGGCGVTYSQGFKLLGPPDLQLLEQGYAHATATFNTFQVTCNPTLSAETTMMVKEHFSEAYAPPELTLGTGGSGGAIQQYQIVQNYPGLLDAAAPLLPFPDAISIATDVLDCGLLERFGRDGAGADWTADERLAVTGHLAAGTCTFWEQTFVPNVNPTTGCTLDLLGAAAGSIDGLSEDGVPPGVDDALAYDAETNPDGLRCTLQDGNVNVVGRDPDTGFARRPWDNVGVQYGLAALNDGSIDLDQFIALNEGIGSFDIDGVWSSERAEASPDAVRIAYEAGAVNQGLGDLRRIPIISVNLWTDEDGDIHTRDRAFTARERLRLEDGTLPPNHMLWTRGLPEGETLVDSLTGSVSLGAEVIGVLDEWATAMADAVPDRDGADEADLWAALEETRPADAVDNCITPDGERVSSLTLYEEPGPCTDPFPVSSTPRRVAGAPLVHDILKCQLHPVIEAVDAGVYEFGITPEDAERIAAVFPEGVCDWTQPGVDQVEMTATWQDFTDLPNG